MTTIPTRLHAALNAQQPKPTATRPTNPNVARLRAPRRPQVRRYTVQTLMENGDFRETRHLAPALPLFEDAFCAFARGSLVDTETGPMAIEDLLPGDRVRTIDGDAQPILWKGSVTIVPGMKSIQRRDMKLTRLMADCFGMSRPMSSVIAGPSARLLHAPEQYRALSAGRRVLTPVRDFVDGVNVIETAPPTAVELFHLCLPRHAVIRVGGLEFESYHPGETALRMTGDAMRALFLGLFDHVNGIGGFGPLAFARAGDGQVNAMRA